MRNVFGTGAIGPFQPNNSKVTIFMLISACCVFATTSGYDSGLMNGINIMPRYTAFFQLTTVTKALSTCANYIGWGIAALTMGPVIESLGRKNGVVVAIMIKVIGIVTMTAAQNVAMFVAGRILLGVGKGTSAIASSTWLAETLPPNIRGKGLSSSFSVFFVGALLAAGITYGTATLDSDWCWRVPCALQSVFSFLCVVILLFTPESPRWLAYHGYSEDALKVIASIYADGDSTNSEVRAQYRQILEHLEFEKTQVKSLSYAEMFKGANTRKRTSLVVSVALIAMLSGNNIVSYYLGDMLTHAGIYNSNTQLKINIVLNSWSLCCALTGTMLMDKAGRKTLGLVATIGMTVFLFLVGAFTKLYGNGSNLSGAYATVAMIFMFQGSYSIGITPLTYLYPPEIMNYSIRTNGMALFSLAVNLTGLFSTFVFPIALAAIGWELYIINAVWDALEAIFIGFFWVETKGLTLEQIDLLMGGSRGIVDMPSSSSPDLAAGTEGCVKRRMD
ncbi:MFS sugar transporter-like protein [Thozetella sp. PMI_491]|nr:MFS sugar transporter-like protein [Thozetella sp. PMI_491]